MIRSDPGYLADMTSDDSQIHPGYNENLLTQQAVDFDTTIPGQQLRHSSQDRTIK